MARPRPAAVVPAAAATHVLLEDLAAPMLADDDRHHLMSVLRLRPGEVVTATDGVGGWRTCVWSGPGSELVADGPVVRVPRPSPSLTVAFPAVKGDRPEWAVQKLTELGVDRIVIVETDRGVVRWSGARGESHLGRLRSVARQALMQSRGCWLPTVEGVVPLRALGVGRRAAALAGPDGGPPTLEVATVVVGPEGGWSPDEDALPWPRVCLGTAVLRTETAAVTAGVLLTALRGGLVVPAAIRGQR